MYHRRSDAMPRLLALSMMLSASAHAVVCKSVDADGVVSYTDVPRSECANPIRLPDYSRYAPRLIPGTAGESSASPGQKAFTGYESMRIVAPQTGGSVRNDEGRVPVLITLEPGLQQGHRVTLTIDGRPLSTTFDDLSIELSGVQRGSHELRAAISDASGKRLIESSSVQFTMRQAARTASSEGAEAGSAEADSQQDATSPPVAELDGAATSDTE